HRRGTLPAQTAYALHAITHTSTPQIYTLSLHDALPIFHPGGGARVRRRVKLGLAALRAAALGALVLLLWNPSAARVAAGGAPPRSEEHTSELQSLRHLVCRLLLEKKKNGH